VGKYVYEECMKILLKLFVIIGSGRYVDYRLEWGITSHIPANLKRFFLSQSKVQE